WSYVTNTLADGLHNFTATDTLSGSTSSASSAFAVTVDTFAPAAPIITGDVTNSDNSVSLTGTALDHAVGGTSDLIKICDGSTLLNTTTTTSSGGWSYTTSPLSSGLHAFTATVTDLAGNTSAPSDVVDPPIGPAAPAIASFSPHTGSLASATDANSLT